LQLFHDVKVELNGIMNDIQKTQDVDYIKIHETEKSGLSLQITKTRSKVLKTLISSPDTSVLKSKKIQWFNYKDCTISSASTTNNVLSIPILTKISKEILHEKENIIGLIGTIFMDFLEKFEGCVHADLGDGDGILALLPRADDGAGTEGIGAGAAESVPVGDGEAQVLLHGFAVDDLGGVVVAEGERVGGAGALVGDGLDLGEVGGGFFHGKEEGKGRTVEERCGGGETVGEQESTYKF
jgi:hypothetical protein